MQLRGSLRWAPILALAVAAACGGDDDNVTNPTGTIGLATNVDSITLTQGVVDSVGITLVRSGNFTGDVTLAADNVPTGVTFDFNPATILGGSTTSWVRLTPATDATLGTNTMTIKASGTNVSDATKSVVVTIAAPASSSISR